MGQRKRKIVKIKIGVVASPKIPSIPHQLVYFLKISVQSFIKIHIFRLKYIVLISCNVEQAISNTVTYEPWMIQACDCNKLMR